jgi:hypothetical protein
MAVSTDQPSSAHGGRVSAAHLPLTIYFCYSRASDYSFASELAAALDMLPEFDVVIDRSDIHEGEDWQGRLAAQIEAAGTVVYVMSARSAISPTCRWELKEAERLSKRIVPVLAQPLGGTPPPEQVSKLQYIRFDHGHSFVEGLSELRTALNDDLIWLAEHSRLYSKARDWDLSRRPDNRLLAGDDVRLAKAWLDQQPARAPLPTPLHRDFIRASDLLETERRSVDRSRAEGLGGRVRQLQTMLVAAVAGIVAVGGFAYYLHDQSSNAVIGKKQAEAAWRELTRLSHRGCSRHGGQMADRQGETRSAMWVIGQVVRHSLSAIWPRPKGRPGRAIGSVGPLNRMIPYAFRGPPCRWTPPWAMTSCYPVRKAG